jgi:transcriptional regulator with XRE-family HTH domain
MSRAASKKRIVHRNNLGCVLRCWRLMKDLGLRDAAKQIGIGGATLMRIEQGREPDFRTVMRILKWLERSETNQLRGGKERR